MGIEEYIKEGKVTHEAVVDVKELELFTGIHDEHLKGKCPDPIFKPTYTFAYRPTNVGTCLTITCKCGESKDITDYKSW